MKDLKLEKNDCVKFKHGETWLYGFVEEINGDYCEVSYGSKNQFDKVMRGDKHTLHAFCDVAITEIVPLGYNLFSTITL